jgi:hypothetical protein
MPLQRVDSTQTKPTRRVSRRLEHTESFSSVRPNTQHNIQTTQMPSQRAELSRNNSRPSPSQEVLAADLPYVPHDTLATYYTASKRESIVEEDRIQDSEDISKVSLLELQKKYRQLEQQLKKTYGQCSDLVEEITSLRAKNLVDDESTLRDSFNTLDFSIRSWCIRLREHKIIANQSMSLTYPFASDKASYSFKTPADELYFLISGLWVWLIKLIFDGATDMENDDPDLWVDESTSVAMRNLERFFLTRGEMCESYI